jgi:hypothetical protein
MRAADAVSVHFFERRLASASATAFSFFEDNPAECTIRWPTPRGLANCLSTLLKGCLDTSDECLCCSGFLLEQNSESKSIEAVEKAITDLGFAVPAALN